MQSAFTENCCLFDTGIDIVRKLDDKRLKKEYIECAKHFNLNVDPWRMGKKANDLFQLIQERKSADLPTGGPSP